MDTPRKEGDTVPPFLPAEDFSTGVFDMAQLDDHLLGTVVAGRYTVTRLLGTGGMGRVYEAFDAAEQREVALKVLHADRIGSTQAVQRFMEEARVLSMLSHPNVVRLYDFGQDDSGVVFLVMEMLVGRDLGDHLAERRRLPWSEASQIALQLCRGLSAAHDRGIVHRDLKPENVFLLQVPPGAAPRIKLLDFGIAKDVQSHNAKLTGEGSVFGTARYMSPEQATGSPVDARSDVYAVGILVYEMITGRPPFVGDDFLRTAHQHVTDPYPPLSQVAPDVPFHPLVEEMIDRALAKRREDRFATMFDFEAAIEGTTIESTMAIIRPKLPPERPRPAEARPSDDRTVIRPPPVDERAAARPVPVPEDRTAAIAAPDFDDDFAATVVRPTTGEVLMPAPEDRTVMRATLVPPPAVPAPPREERTVVRAAPIAEEPPRPARRQAPPPHDERTVVRQSPLGVAGTIVPLTQPPYATPAGPPPSFPMPPPPMPAAPMPAPIPVLSPNDGDTVAMQIPIMDPYGPAPMPMPMPMPQPYQPPAGLAPPVVHMPAPTPAPVPRQGAAQFAPSFSGGQAGRPSAPGGFGPPPPVVASTPSGLGGLVGGPGLAPGGWSGGGLAGLPMPASSGRDGGLGGDGQPVFAREENAAFMPAHLAGNLAPTRLANAPTQARPVSPEDLLATPYRPRAWAEDAASPAESSWSGNETGEMLLRLPQRETSRNAVVAIVMLTIVALALIGFAVWALLRDEPDDTEDAKPHRATTVEQPRPIAPVIAPKRELVIKDTEPAPKKPQPPPPMPEPEPPRPEPEPFDDPEPRPQRRTGGGGGGGGGGSESPVASLSQAQLDAGFKKARSGINSCAKKHGAIEGTSQSVSFDVVEGRAINVKVQPPHGLTPLGQCVAGAVAGNARFAAATEASRAVTRKVSF